ncbi:hypothetical protein AB0J51_07390 [Micromonospora echinofusca]|uniref:hypothetical protein n=1 Tax=Micromonospora echinofusca TaxID=47858 RepID=UPI00342D5941
MSDAYTVYWPQERWRAALGVRRPLEVLFGGPHLSEPSFLRAKVRPGDTLYPIGVNRQVLFVFGRMRVRELVTAEDTLDSYFESFHVWRFLAPTCTNEVVLGVEGTRVHGNRALPGDVLRRMTYLPRKGPRPVKHVSPEGLLTSSISVQGIYRLAPASAADLDAVLAGPPTPPVPRQRELSAECGTSPLF